MMNGNAIVATWRRQLSALLGNPLAYVFILAFVLATVFLMFGTDDFFKRNIADIEPLRKYMLYPLIVLIPALAMGAWASERELGTEEQLLSMPMSIIDVLLGKWLGIATFFTITLACSWCNVFILEYLGSPDYGLIIAQFIGWWFAGLYLISLAILASCLVSMPAIAFVIGVCFCGLGALALNASTWLDPFERGLIPLPSVLMTLLLIAAPLAVASVWLSLRRWQAKHADRYNNIIICTLGFAVVAFNALVVLDRLALDVDITEENLSTLSSSSVDVLDAVERRIEIIAFISAELPESKDAALPNKAREIERMLKSIKRYGGKDISITIERPLDVLDEKGVKASEHYGLKPKRVEDDSVSGRGTVEVFMGAVVRSGAQMQIIEHFDPGLSVEYELVRAINAVGQKQRRIVGIIDNDFKVTGGYDFQTRQMRREWALVAELRKQYDIRNVRLDSDVDEEIDALLVVQASRLKDEELQYLHDAIWNGMPALIMEDPMPYFSGAQMGSSRGRVPPQQNPMQPQQGPPDIKGNIHPLINALGVQYVDSEIIWSSYNISHEFREAFPKDFVWTFKDAGGISQASPICTGIDGMLLPFPGAFGDSLTAPKELTVTSLLTPVPEVNNGQVVRWGRNRWNDFIGQSFMGMQFKLPDNYVSSFGSLPRMAVEIKGKMKRAYNFRQTDDAPSPADEKDATEGADEKKEKKPSGKGKLSEKDIHVVLIGDTDFAHDNFYMLYRNENNSFSENEMSVFQSLRNVQFIANAIDELLGESGFLDLRTRRAKARPLTTLNDILQEKRSKRMQAFSDAKRKAQEEISKLNKRKDERLKEIDQRTDIDSKTKSQIKAQAEIAEEKKTMADIAKVERNVNKEFKKAQIEERREVLRARQEVRYMAVGLPAVVLILLVMAVFFVRLKEEQSAVPSDRQRSES